MILLVVANKMKKNLNMIQQPKLCVTLEVPVDSTAYFTYLSTRNDHTYKLPYGMLF